MNTSREEIRDTLFELLEREAGDVDFQRYAGAHTSIDFAHLEDDLDAMYTEDAIGLIENELARLRRRQKGLGDG